LGVQLVMAIRLLLVALAAEQALSVPHRSPIAADEALIASDGSSLVGSTCDATPSSCTPLEALTTRKSTNNKAYTEHGWQTNCVAPCTFVNASQMLPSNGDTVLGATTMDAQSVGKLGVRSTAARKNSDSATCSELAGKTLRVRTPLSDGFFVRAQFALILGQFAATCGIAHFIDPAVSPSCASLTTTCSSAMGLTGITESDCQSRHVCDGYYDPSLPGNAWEQYFEPVGGENASDVTNRLGGGDSASIVELPGDLSWGLFSLNQAIYPSSYSQAVKARTSFAALAELWAKVQPEILSKAEATWTSVVKSKSPAKVLGVHIRGTDKFISQKMTPSTYFSTIDSYVSKYDNTSGKVVIFLATDDDGYRSEMTTRYGDRVVTQPDVVRATGSSATWKTDGGSPSTKGLTTLMDSLLLSKCDYLLKSASAVSEYAIYYNTKLINNSYDFSISDHPTAAFHDA